MTTLVEWAIGQRVRNEAEPSLGLGVVHGFPNNRTLQVIFPGAGESRIYNVASAPLRRFELGIGQPANTRDGRAFRVERIEHKDGCLVYHGQGMVIPELDLADASSSNDPLQRLIDGEFTHHSAFDLREKGWQLRSEVLHQRCQGLTGARVSLLPHQLAIAYKISTREYPRVLLADEVGLGKTIEACMIYSALRSLGRAERVLILTPSSLVHQWLTELYRRFHELFTVAHSELIPVHDEELKLHDHAVENPFSEASRIIAPLDWLLKKNRLAQALDQPWDLVIVDEAHHLQWSRQEASPSYRAVEALAARSQGLLLLTATPLRQGLETEYGLLHLVDPERFGDFDRFASEHSHFRDVADLARRLTEGDRTVIAELAKLFPEGNWEGSASECLRQLIDRHGTGRVLIRNRRDKLGGFPGRVLHLTRLPLPESSAKSTAWPEIVELSRILGAPEVKGDKPSAKDDPRWNWVLEFIRSLGDQKVVVMASAALTAKRLEKIFRQKSGLKVAMFHEELSLIERDRQAAYFADPDGAQVLFSSEIGGEGRNFQFCHHLVLFDLPLHPDALEQRIGRLDRIGQTETIQVHLAIIEDSPMEALYEWHKRLGVFDAPLTGGEHLMEAQSRELLDVLKAAVPGRRDQAKLDAFLGRTSDLLLKHRADVQSSVDFLIDLNSFDQELGQSLVDEVLALNYDLLEEVVSGLLEHFGVIEDDLADRRIKRIRPGDLMKVDPFPGLRAGGCLATYDRSLALAREDIQFLSPDHPLVEGAVALLLDQHEGRATLALWPHAPEQSIWVQFLFLLEAVGPPRLELSRFLPPTSVALTVDMKGQWKEVPEGVRIQAVGTQIWSRLLV